MKKTIQIPQGNEFSLFVPFVVLSKNGREDASAALWNNVQVVVRMSNKQTDIPHTTNLQEQYVIISFDNSLKLGSYDVIISGEYEGRNVSAPLNNHFAITAWADGNYAEFVVGQPIICPTQTIIGQFNTTQDIIDLTEELRAALAAAEAAKEEYEEKVEELSDVAQQSTLTEGIANIRGDIAGISIDTSTIAKQGTNASATLTATQTAATNAYASAEAAKTATIDGNDTAVGVAKEIRGEVGTGSDTAAETGTLFAVVKWVKDKVKSIFNLIGSPASGQPATLFAAIAAGGGGGSADALETEVETGKTAIASAIVQKGGTATATDSLATLASEVQNIPNVTKQFVQTDFIEQWTGSTSMDCLAIIRQYYNSLYPTAQCYAAKKGTLQTIPSGADKMIYYDTSGVLTTIDNPSGDYIIGAPSGEDVGFCLLQYVNNTITTITPSNYVYSCGIYNADVTIVNFASSSITLIQMEDCEIEIGSDMGSSALSLFLLYGNSAIKNGTISVSGVFRETKMTYISLPNVTAIIGASPFTSATSLYNVNLPDLGQISSSTSNFFASCTNLQKVSLPKLEIGNSEYMFRSCSAIKEIEMPLFEGTFSSYSFNGCSELRKLYVPKFTGNPTSTALSSDINLIDITCGEMITTNWNIAQWNPTNALLTNSTSLVDPDETFTSNREKLLYNIRTHIAANLPDRTGLSALTITFASAMKTAINADTATKNAFTNKNWTIA